MSLSASQFAPPPKSSVETLVFQFGLRPVDVNSPLWLDTYKFLSDEELCEA